MFYAVTHKYDKRYGDKDVVTLHRFQHKYWRDNFIAGDRKRRAETNRSHAMELDKKAFARNASWSFLSDENEQWVCDRPIMDKPEPMTVDPLTYKQLKEAAHALRETCFYECGCYINELASEVSYLVNTLPVNE